MTLRHVLHAVSNACSVHDLKEHVKKNEENEINRKHNFLDVALNMEFINHVTSENIPYSTSALNILYIYTD